MNRAKMNPKNVLLYRFVLWALLFVLVHSDDGSPTVTIAQGTLVGHIYNTSYGSYYAFQGIPYAKPPVGDLRFSAPVAAEPWNGTFQATKEGPVCLQPESYLREISGAEDCLFVNVYSSQLPDPNNLLPVMVWIHGGGFVSGSGNVKDQGPAFLLNNGVVYVSLNYRLGVFGFLSTEDEVVPGNAGLKDQVLALRWVQKNIAAFGGDPEKVTIFGESAGAVSVSHHLLSPMSKGLFRGAISQSGCSASPVAVGDKGTSRKTAFYLGEILGYNGNSSQELVKVLRSEVASQVITPSTTHDVSSLIYSAIVEPEIEGEESFLTDDPLKMLAQGKFNKVPYLTGLNSGEGLGFLQEGILDGSISPDYVNKNFAQMFQQYLIYCKTGPCGEELLAKIKSFYFGGDVTSTNLQRLVDMATDMMVGEGQVYETDKISSLGNNSVYFYELSYEGAVSFRASIPGASNFTGVPHADDLYYLFERGEIKPGSTDALVRTKMVEMWTNFVKTGNPTPDSAKDLTKWLPYTSSATYYLDINAEQTLKTDFRKKSMDFFKQLYGSS